MFRRIEGPRLCLTFDDGPDPDFTPAVLDLLAGQDCRATFFLLGDSARRYPRLVKRIATEGHSIGNHTLSHPRAGKTGSDRDCGQVTQCQEILAEITGKPPRWFRPPYGRLNSAMAAEAERLGMTTVLWSVSAVDWGPLGSRRGIARRLGRARAGDIVLLHDAARRHNHPDRTLAVLPGFLQTLRERAIEAVTLDDCTPTGFE